MLDKQKLILSKINLTSITKTIKKPLYDLESIKPGIIHLGLGNFHRAHQALYLDDLFNMDIDNVDVVGTTAVETGDLSALMNADAASKAGATGTAGDEDSDNAGGVTSHRELATITN